MLKCTTGNLINIEGNGKLNDERSIYDFINKAPFSLIIEDNPKMNNEGSCRIVHYLNGENLLPESIYLECSIMLQEEKKIAVSIAVLDEN